MVEPIKPKDVVKAKQETLPDEVIEAFNELIAENWKGEYAKFKLAVVAERIRKKLGWGDEKAGQISKNGWLDVEDVYRKAGWKVVYDGPAYNETYQATFEFSQRRKK